MTTMKKFYKAKVWKAMAKPLAGEHAFEHEEATSLRRTRSIVWSDEFIDGTGHCVDVRRGKFKVSVEPAAVGRFFGKLRAWAKVQPGRSSQGPLEDFSRILVQCLKH